MADGSLGPYAGAELALHNPEDGLASSTLEDFTRFVYCLEECLSPKDFDAVRSEQREQCKRMLITPRHASGDTLPQESLYIQALPSGQPVLEQFKHLYRMGT